MKVQAKAQLKSLRVSPRKVRLVIDLIRGLDVERALNELTFSKKAAARPVKKLLESAVANAVHNQSIKREGLTIETVYVDEGRVLKRWMPRAMGRATPLRKRSSHITIVLSGIIDAVALANKKAEQKAPETEEPTEEKAVQEKKSKPAAKKKPKKQNQKKPKITLNPAT